MFATWKWVPALLASTLVVGACDRGDLGEEPVARCVPEGACDETMFQGGIRASLGDAARGARLWADNCTKCHGEAGVGMGDAALIDMTSPAWHASQRDAMIVKTVRGGRGMKMPAFTFDDQALRDLLAHVRRLEVRPTTAPGPKGGY
ncbi:MAG: c-type cytochrome [Deltaproteobacteria bacterium]|nr:c-type cytochrome [Deltaproteobacteria bacterium]